MSPGHRNTICVENAEVLQHSSYPSDQFVLRMQAPECAKRAKPGSFVHIRCDADIPMRRPLSIMRVAADQGWIEVLYKFVGAGLSALSKLTVADTVNILGPIGNGFYPDPARPLAVMIGGGVGIPPLIFLGERLHEELDQAGTRQRNTGNAHRPVAFFGSEIPFPFELQESALSLETGPTPVNTTISLMEEWNIPCRLASAAGISGCYPGYVTDLAQQWLKTSNEVTLDQATIYACGPKPMLEAAARLAREFNLPSQLCLEEFMACGVGGCAGCAVRVETENGPAMRRVCVDGPVFDGDSVYPPS